MTNLPQGFLALTVSTTSCSYDPWTPNFEGFMENLLFSHPLHLHQSLIIINKMSGCASNWAAKTWQAPLSARADQHLDFLARLTYDEHVPASHGIADIPMSVLFSSLTVQRPGQNPPPYPADASSRPVKYENLQGLQRVGLVRNGLGQAIFSIAMVSLTSRHGD